MIPECPMPEDVKQLLEDLLVVARTSFDFSGLPEEFMIWIDQLSSVREQAEREGDCIIVMGPDGPEQLVWDDEDEGLP